MIAVLGTTVAALKEHLRDPANRVWGFEGLGDKPDDEVVYFPIEAAEIRSQLAQAMTNAREMTNNHQIEQWWVEDSGSAGGILAWAKDLPELAGVKFNPIALAKINKDRRLQGLQMALLEGRVRFPQTFWGRDILMKRLSEYPKSQSDDLPDALAFLTNPNMKKGIVKVAKPPADPYTPQADPSSILYKAPNKRKGYF